jgi:dipeptidyl aminopeptidase/acylaminoacyl peptidase
VKRYVPVAAAACLIAWGSLQAQPAPPRTTAEAGDYQGTTRYADVVAFGESLTKRSPAARLDWFGVSGEGRKLPLVVLAEPMVDSAEAARRSGKLVVLLIGNIHAGEVDGKEALLMLARDVVTGADKALLKDLIVLVAPILNADGNERIAKGKRPEQAGPDEGVGDRENAGGLDLNRDFVKLESPEVRGLVRCIRTWDPAVILDTHTTNGSYHRHTLTYDGPRNPNAPLAVRAFGGAFVPAAADRLRAATGFSPFPYGNFSADRTRWETYPTQPRYGVQYFAVRGRLGVLSESYAYAPFRDRVRASMEFARGVCHEAAARKDDLKKAIAPTAPPARLVLRTKPAAEDSPRTVLGFEEVAGRDGRKTPTDRPKEYSVRYWSRVEPTLEVQRPYAYLVPAGYAAVVENLQRHGINVHELREDIDLDVELAKVTKVERANRPYQGHVVVRNVEVAPRKETRRVPAGTLMVRTDQPLGVLAGLLLEPQSNDGLTTWNYFDKALADGTDFPVMRLPAEAAVIAGAVRPLAEERGKDRPIGLDSMFGQGPPPNFSGNPVSGLQWLDDGEHFLQTKAGKPLKVHARTGRSSVFVDADKLAESLKSVLDEGAAKALAQRSATRTDPGKTGVLVEHQGDLYFGSFDGKPGVRLTKSPDAKEFPTFSPDGKLVAFVRKNNLLVVDLETQTEKALTTDGNERVFNGKGDWVYEEEIFNRANKGAFWWSPDSAHVAFLRIDDAPVAEFAVVNHLPTRLNVEKIPYPKAGDPNPLVKLGIVPVTGGATRWAEFNGTDPADFLIARVGWFPDGKSAYCYAQNRAQTHMDLCQVPLEGGPVRKRFRDSTSAWVDDTGPLTFLPDGSFLYASDRTGWRHLYRYHADGAPPSPVTAGPWEVRQVHRLDPAGEWVYFSGTKDTHRGTNLYRARTDGSKVERLTPDAGTHAVNVSPKATLFVDSYSSLAEPTRVVLRAADGAAVRTLDTNPVYAREEYQFGRVEPVEVPMPDGFTLEGLIVYPPDFDPAKQYPVWVKTYAGPHAPTVNDGWAGGRVNDQVYANLGIVVFNVDPRSASGKGAQSAWTAYKQLGIPELKDLEAAVDWICKNPWADAGRVGLSGHSYGGFITAFALTHSKKFAAGIAGAPVTDWRNYDTIYTERFMHLPSENKSGYDATSVVKAAKNLHGKLLLLHGLIDDNVHVQNTVQLIHQLQLADKDFEVMMYPTARHGIGGRHYQRQVINFVCRAMGIDVRVPPGDGEAAPPRNRRPARRAG